MSQARLSRMRGSFSPLGRLNLPARILKPATALLAVTGVAVAAVIVAPASTAIAAPLTPRSVAGAKPGGLHLRRAARPNPPKLPSDLPRKNGVPFVPPQPPRPPRSHALPKPAKNIGSYRVSAAVLAFLQQGLGLPLTGSSVLAGLRTGHTITLTTVTGPSLNFGLPRGVTAPRFGRATLVVNPAADTVTVTAHAADATGADHTGSDHTGSDHTGSDHTVSDHTVSDATVSDATVSVTISHASTATLAGGSDLSSNLTLRTPLPGLLPAGHDLGLHGSLSYQAGRTASVALTGSLPGAVMLDPGRARLDAGTRVTVTSGGTFLTGPATLGPSGHSATVTVAGRLAGRRDLSLNGTGRAGPVSLLPGLALGPGATGSLTDVRGSVAFDVRAPAAGTWTPMSGVSLTGGTVEYADTLPAGRALAAPGIAPGTPWVDVTGTVAVAQTVTAHGTLAANLSTGAALLATSGSDPVTLTGSPGTSGRSVLSQANLGGVLSVTAAGITGPLHGTGRVTVTSPGNAPVLSDTGLTLTGGVLTASFPLDRSVLGLGSAGSLDTAYWSSRATSIAGPSGARISLPAGLSAAPTPSTGPGQRLAGSARPVTFIDRSRSPVSRDPATGTNAGPTGTTGTYTVSAGVYSFITSTLGIALSSQTISGPLSGPTDQTLTTTVAAPGPLPLTMPAGIAAPVFGDTTITIDESANTLTLNASATDGVTAALQVTISSANSAAMTDGSGLSSSLTLGNVPFLDGSTISLSGSLGYGGGSLTASLTGTLSSALALANGAITLQPGTTLSLASGAGLAVSGTAQIGTAGDYFTVGLTGSMLSLSTWSLQVSDTAVTWNPVPSLQVTPAFAGIIADTAGAVTFSLSTTADPAVSWQPGDGATVSLTSFEVSNMAPPSSAGCPSSVTAGDVWFGAAGTFSYAPAGLTGLTAQACVGLAGQAFQVTTTTGTSLTSLFSGSPVQVTGATLTAVGDISAGTFTVTGAATLQVNADTAGFPQAGLSLPVVLSLSNSGVVAAVQVSDLSQVDSSMSGSGTLYLSSSAIADFDPDTLPGLSGSSFDLPQGIAVTLDYALPAGVAQAIGDSSLAGTQLQAVAALGSKGFSIGVNLAFGTGAGGIQIVNSNGVALYLDQVSASFALGFGSGASMTVSGDGYLVLPPMVPGGSGSQVGVSLTGSFVLGGGLSFYVTAAIDGTWPDAFGISGLSVTNLAAQAGIGDGVPSVGISVQDLTLPPSVASAIGVAANATIDFTADLNVADPVLDLSVSGFDGAPALLPLTAVAGGDTSVVDSLQVYSAALYIAPLGGSFNNETFSPGFSVSFDADIFGVSVDLSGSVDPSAPSISFSLIINGGLPSNLDGTGVTMGGSLTGSINSSGFNATGTGYLAGDGQVLSISFDVSIPGAFDWSGVIGQIVQFFESIGTSVAQVAQIMASLGYTAYDAINSVGGQYTAQLASTVESWFDTGYYDIWTLTSTGEDLVLDVNGASQAPNTNVITWLYDSGSNQQWMFVPAPVPGYFEIANHNSGQCLSVYGPSTTPGTDLVQYPCFGGENQLWYLGSIELDNTYVIPTPFDSQYIDIQNAYPWPDGTVDQWPWNGNQNQQFYLTNSVG